MKYKTFHCLVRYSISFNFCTGYLVESLNLKNNTNKNKVIFIVFLLDIMLVRIWPYDIICLNELIVQ